MPDEWMHLPLDNGREFLVGFRDKKEDFQGIVPSELLDDELGNDADEVKRRKRVVDHGDQIVKALRAKRDGGIALPPFDRVVLKEAKDAH